MCNERSNQDNVKIVPFFKNGTEQIKFEFWFLIITFFLACYFAHLIQFQLELRYSDKVALCSLLGGFFGGWVYDAKWFYRVTARGKNNQLDFIWESHKFYWRLFIPFLASLVAFCTYTILSPDTLEAGIKGHGRAKIAFSICFILGYFSDLVLSRLAAWAEKLLPKQ